MGAGTRAAGAALPTTPPNRKRKHADYAANPLVHDTKPVVSKKHASALSISEDTQPAAPPKKARVAKPTGATPEEKRLRRQVILSSTTTHTPNK